MKKLLSVFVCFVIVLSCSITASAAATGSLSGAASVTTAKNGEYTISLSGCADATSVAVSVSFSDNFSLVSGSWLKSGSITNFDLSTKKGALGGLSSPNINGNLFKVVLKANTASAAAQNVSITVTAKNGGSDIFSQTFSKSVKITCRTHSFNTWSDNGKTNHTHTCSVCGYVETVNHTWDKGTVTKKATCKEDGSKQYTCTACGAVKTEVISKNSAHTYGKYTVVKEPTCTESGLQTAQCTVCGKETKKTIEALGHKYGNWENVTEATCTAGGEQKRVCENCKKEEKRTTDKLPHDFESPKLVKEATIYSTGLMSGKCKNCGETTEQIIPCSYTDDKTGIKLTADEGVFANGTVINITEQDKESDSFKNAGYALKGVTEEFTLFDITASLDGQAVIPNGKIKVTLTVPEGYGKDVSVYCIGDDAKIEKLETTLSNDGKTIEAELEHFSLYAVCKAGAVSQIEEPVQNKDTTDIQNTDTGSENGKRNIVPIIIFAVVAVLVVALVIILAVISQRKKYYRF